MLTLIIGAVVLAVLYGLAWHNQPSKERETARPGNRHVHASMKERKI
jgi:hypothetical protein